MTVAVCGGSRASWCLGSQEFREQLFEKLEGKLGDNHAGDLRFETAQADSALYTLHSAFRWAGANPIWQHGGKVNRQACYCCAFPFPGGKGSG